jgi:hypothetical protein
MTELVPFDAPERQDSRGVSCWLGTQYALPSLHLRPDGQKWLVTVFVITSDMSALPYAYKAVDFAQLQSLLIAYRQSPEQALADWWGTEPPTSASGPKLRPSGKLAVIDEKDSGL